MKKLSLVLVALLITANCFSQICPNFSIENKYNYINVLSVFNNTSIEEVFINNKQAGVTFHDLKYEIVFDFNNNKVYWTSSDFQGVNTYVHDIVSTEYNNNFIIVNCTMYYKIHDQIVNETIKLNMKDKTCLYYYTQSKPYIDPGLKDAGMPSVNTSAEFFEFN